MTDNEWEKLIRKTLHKLAKQRLTTVLQSQNLWVTDHSPEMDEKTFCAIQTAIMRGWVSIVHDNVPTGDLLNPAAGFYKVGAIYGLTDSGWRVIHGEFRWIVIAAIAGVTSVVIAILPYLAKMLKH